MKLSIGLKLAIPVIITIIIELLFITLIAQEKLANTFEKIVNNEFTQTMKIVENQFSFMEQSSIYTANILTENQELKKAILSSNLTTLEKLMNNKTKNMKVDNIIITDKYANIMSQKGLFHVNADNLQSYHLVHEALHNKTISVIERVGDIFVFYTAVPIIYEHQVIGEVLIGLQLSNEVLIKLAKGSNIELAIVGDRALGATSLKDENNESIVNLPVNYAKYQWLLNGKIDLLSAKIGKNDYYIKAKELRLIDKDTTNASLMMLYDKKEYKEQIIQAQKMQMIVLFILITSLLLSVFILSIYLKKGFAKLIVGLQKVSRGKYGHQVKINSRDELETLAYYFNEMSSTIESKENKLRKYTLSLEETVNRRTQELSHKNLFLQKLLDLQENMIVVVENSKITFTNKSYLDFYACAEEDNSIDVHALEQHKHEIILKNCDDEERIFTIEKLTLNKKSYMLIYDDVTQIKKNEINLYEKATKDFLTKLYNRVKFEETFPLMKENAFRNNKLLSLAICDIDYFKIINDTYGHLVGDEVLKTLAEILTKHLRKNDIVARWGGEEFIIAMQTNTIEEAEKIIEKLREGIEIYLFKDAEKITCSFGLTLVKKDETEDTTFLRADNALYNAKNKGRNRVEILL